MEIRPDLKDVETLLRRLAQFASVFYKNNFDTWPQLKNREDYDRVYRLDHDLKWPLEKIYGQGRDLAVFMSSHLVAFNHPDLYPTLKKFVDSFDNGWLYQIEELTNDSQIAKNIYNSLNHQPWSIGQMIQLYDAQISLLGDVKTTLDRLKESNTYKFDSDTVQATNSTEDIAESLTFTERENSILNRLAEMYENGTTQTSVSSLFDATDIDNGQRHSICESLKVRGVINPSYQLGQKLPYAIEILPAAIVQRSRLSASNEISVTEPVQRTIADTIYRIALLWFGDPNARFAKFFAIAGVALVAAPWWQPVLQQVAVRYLNVPATFLVEADRSMFWSGWVFIVIALSLYIWVKQIQNRVKNIDE